MNEGAYKSKVLDKICEMFPKCILFKPDAAYGQGLPDLVILYNNRWASLEFKKSKKSSKQPNQDHYIELLNKMSFAAYIYPENEEEILHALEQALKTGRRTRVSKS